MAKPKRRKAVVRGNDEPENNSIERISRHGELDVRLMENCMHSVCLMLVNYVVFRPV